MSIQTRGNADHSLFCSVCHVPWDEDNEGCSVCKEIRYKIRFYELVERVGKQKKKELDEFYVDPDD